MKGGIAGLSAACAACLAVISMHYNQPPKEKGRSAAVRQTPHELVVAIQTDLASLDTLNARGKSLPESASHDATRRLQSIDAAWQQIGNSGCDAQTLGKARRMHLQAHFFAARLLEGHRAEFDDLCRTTIHEAAGTELAKEARVLRFLAAYDFSKPQGPEFLTALEGETAQYAVEDALALYCLVAHELTRHGQDSAASTIVEAAQQRFGNIPGLRAVLEQSRRPATAAKSKWRAIGAAPYAPSNSGRAPVAAAPNHLQSQYGRNQSQQVIDQLNAEGERNRKAAEQSRRAAVNIAKALGVTSHKVKRPNGQWEEQLRD